MSVKSVLTAGRAAAERLMVDTCTIRRQTGESMDPVTLQMTPIYTTLYSGKCRVQQQGEAVDALTPTAGERSFTLMHDIVISIPITVTGIQVDDVIEITEAVHDDDLVGRRYRVRAFLTKTHATARRLASEVILA